MSASWLLGGDLRLNRLIPETQSVAGRLPDRLLGNEALMTECCGFYPRDPDRASGIIMEALGKRLHE